MNRFKPIVCVFAILVASVGFCGPDQQRNEAADVQARRAEFETMFDQMKPVKIYGKVVDTEGHPISETEVKLMWQQSTILIGKTDLGRFDSVTSRTDGCWDFTVQKPYRAFVQEARKEGYEYTTRYNQESSVRNLVEHRTTRDLPVVTVLRKKGETTFLIQSDGPRPIRAVFPHSQTNSLDLLAEKGDKFRAGSYADLQVAIEYGRTGGAWTVTYSASNGTDGIVTDTNLLYEAPQEGYQKEVVLNGPPWPRYLYLRSRTPAIYSRLDLEYFIWRGSDTNQTFSINYKAWVNPYGERNLEYDTDLENEWRLIDQLGDQAKTAIRQNKRPAKPDLPKLVKEAKEKAEKDKGKP